MGSSPTAFGAHFDWLLLELVIYQIATALPFWLLPLQVLSKTVRGSV